MSGIGIGMVNLKLIGKQTSLEHEISELKRELYDGKERELDLKDQLQFLETNGKKLQKKVRDLEEENDNLSKQLKKISLERSINAESTTSNDAHAQETDTELKIQLALSEKELLVLKKNMSAMDEENEALHRQMFLLEKRLKDQERQLSIIPEPSSPKSYYEDKIKDYEKEANEFRSKLLDKENEIERLYAQIQSLQSQSGRGKSLRRSRSLDLESDYNLVVELRRQVEMGHQENEVLKERIQYLKEDKSCLMEELTSVRSKVNESSENSGLAGLAVAFIETENEEKLNQKLQQLETSKSLILRKIENTVRNIQSLNETHLPKQLLEHIFEMAKTPRTDEIIESRRDADSDNTPSSGVEETNVMEPISGNSCESNDFTTSEKQQAPGKYHCLLSDAEVSDSVQTINESRDLDKLLSVIEKYYSVLVKRLSDSCAEMDSDDGKVVPLKPEGVNGNITPPEEVIEVNDAVKNHSFENKMCEFSEKLAKEIIQSLTCPKNQTPEHEENKMELSRDTKCKNGEMAETVKNKEGEKDLSSDEQASDDNELSRKYYKEKISYLEEEVDDLRLIIKSKEEKSVLLEDEVEELEAYVKKLQDDSRRRDMELLSEMDLIHGKNEILNNLLEIVQDRAEAAEDELERVITEINEAQDSSSISSGKSNSSTAPARDSDGSDDVFEGSPVDKSQVTAFWEEQFKKRIRSLETLLAEERKKSSSLLKKLEINGTDVITSAMSDDAKLRMREKELLQSELHESQKHAVLANDQIRSLTEKLKKVETERWRSPKLLRKPQGSASSDDTGSEGKMESYCRTCADLQTVKNQLSDELLIFKAKAEELEIKIEEINEIWISKSAASEREKQGLEQKLAQKTQDCRRLEEQINKLREEDRMKDIFMKERDNSLKDKTAQITRKDEIIQEQEDIIRQREEDLQSLFDQISQREKTIKELTETVRVREERIKEKENALEQLINSIDEKNEELHYLEEEVHESVVKRKESETMIAELQTKIEETLKVEKTEIENENERLQSDIENLMGNITELHTDKVTLQNELDKAKHALSEAMLMWERDRSSLGAELTIAREKMRLMEETTEKKESQALQMLRREVHSIIESREKLAHELRLNKMEHENTVRILKTEKFKLTEELTSKIRMLTHEMNNNDKMSDELTKLRGQDDINYQLHHHEKILRAEYMAMKVRYETQLDRLQKEHMQLLEVVLKLQKEKNLDHDIIQGIQRGMANIKATYTTDLSRWKDERTVLTSHISQIEEGKEIAQHLRAQIDALKRQLTDQDVERTDLVNKMTSERRHWEVERAQQTSRINQLEEQLAIFVQAQSKSKDVQYRMEVAWEKERAEQKRLLNEAHSVAMDLQEQLSRRDEQNAREKKNLVDQLQKHRTQYDDEKISREKLTLEMNTGETRVKHLEQQMGDMKDKQKKELDSWTNEKGQLLRRLAEMRKLHLRDVRRIDDVLAALKRLRELATIVIDSDNSATLPSNGNDDNVRYGDASAASASVHSNENVDEMTDLKQNIDQVILKYVKESLRQIHFLTEELARPSSDLSREEKQTLRRSLSSSEIELLKDEFLLGPQESGRVIPEVKLSDSGHSGIQRQITHDGTTINSDRVQPDYIENILMEQSSFYNDAKDAHIEVHRVKTTRDITRVETKVTSLPKPPPSFIIPRSRSTSPGPSTLGKGKQVIKPVLKSMSLETTHSHRLSAPVNGASSKSSSTDSSPVGTYNFIPSSEGNGLGVAGTFQSGSLDRLSPNTARKRFFEAQPNTSASFMSWPERRKRELNPNRNSRSLTGSTELFISESNDDITGNGKLRNSVSMDDGSISVEPRDSHRAGSSEGPVARSRSAENTSKHSGLRDMFMAMKKRLRPKVKRSQSAREHDKIQKLQAVKENEKADNNVDDSNENKNTSMPESSKLKSDSSVPDDSHVTQDQLTPINIPDDDTKQRTSRTSERGKKNKSRSRSPSEKDDIHGSQSTLQRIKNRFRSKSADRARDHREHHVTPILVGHTTTAQAEDQQYSETCV